MHHDIMGVLLAGGGSSRMGTNKALLPLGGRPVIERLVDMMSGLFAELILIANDPDPYQYLGLPIYPDIYVRRGPLAGIHAALTHTCHDRIFVMGCDMPLVTRGMVDHIIAAGASHPVCVPVADGFVQHLCGVYHKSVAEVAAVILNEDNAEVRHESQKKRSCPMMRLCQEVGGKKIEVQEFLSGADALMFANMNRPEEYQKITQHWQNIAAGNATCERQD